MVHDIDAGSLLVFKEAHYAKHIIEGAYRIGIGIRNEADTHVINILLNVFLILAGVCRKYLYGLFLVFLHELIRPDLGLDDLDQIVSPLFQYLA